MTYAEAKNLLIRKQNGETLTREEMLKLRQALAIVANSWGPILGG